MKNTKKHYYLISGEILFKEKESESTFSHNFNTLQINENKFFNKKNIGQAQQAMQLRFFREVAPPDKVHILDAFIKSVSYLGEMTEEEFNKDSDLGIGANEKNDS